MPAALNAEQTAAALPWQALVEAIAALLKAGGVRIPARTVLPTADGAVLFVMPATDGQAAMTKLITFTPGNAGGGRPTIQGDVVVFDAATGSRQLILDGPTATARRTAAVSAFAARELAPQPGGPMLIVGAGVQGRAHLEAFADVLGVREFRIASRSQASADTLVQHARALGLHASAASDADAALAECPLAVTCTPANGVVLRAQPRPDAFIAAVGAFTAQMVELDARLCRHFATQGRIVVDSRDADHEAGDLLQAGIPVAPLATLQDVVRNGHSGKSGAVLFKSCGWAGWDLAAARLALARA